MFNIYEEFGNLYMTEITVQGLPAVNQTDSQMC